MLIAKRVLQQCWKAQNPLFKNLAPFKSFTEIQPAVVSLNYQQSKTPATLEPKAESLLIRQWWSQTPFPQDKPLTVPVYSFLTGEFTGENVELEHSIFNVPLRRDIVHNVYLWKKLSEKVTTHQTRTVSTISGSGKKPHPQKKMGRARQGYKRAPGRYHGAKAHGPKPRIWGYHIPKKLRLQGIKTMLSAKLYEGKLRIIDSERVENPKTKEVADAIKSYTEQNPILLITGYNVDPNFEIAQRNIQKIQVCQPNEIDILQLVNLPRIFVTKDGLRQMVQDLMDQHYLHRRVGNKRRAPLPSEVERAKIFGTQEETEAPQYDPAQPLQFKFKVLEDYVKEYEKMRNEGKDPIDIDPKFGKRRIIRDDKL